jgi:hypothetical protein
MTTTTAGHEPETWYWEAGSDQCPHGAEPDSDSDAWDDWSERHHWSPQDVRVCLDAPMGDVCGACSEDQGDAVSMTVCRARPHAQERPGAPKPTGKHERIIVFVGLYDHLDRDCDELYTDTGDEITGKAHCSHVAEQVICGGCSKRDAAGYYEPAVAWTGPHDAPVLAAAAQEA